MVGTRSREESKKRPSRRSLVDEPISLNAPPPSYAFGDGFLPSTGGTSTVALTVSGHWNPPPTIGEIEAVLMAKGRAQHRICRIEVRADCAIVEVHPDDVPNCIGLLDLGDIQVSGARGARRPRGASPRTCTHARTRTRRAQAARGSLSLVAVLPRS